MVAVQWYPGHMEKARRAMQDSLRQVDMVMEVRDARIPEASRNPMLDQMIQGKARLVILSKADLADPEATALWLQRLTDANQKALALDLANDHSARAQVIAACMELTRAKREKMKSRGILNPRPMRAMACGIPNVGKSTLINRIAGKNTAKTEDRPGVTRNLAWIHADRTLDVLDTPGVLWPKFEHEQTGEHLAALGSVNEDIVDRDQIALAAIGLIQKQYPGLLEQAYPGAAGTPQQMLAGIASARALLKEGGSPDLRRAGDLFLHELRRGALGRITLEWPQ